MQCSSSIQQKKHMGPHNINEAKKKKLIMEWCKLKTSVEKEGYHFSFTIIY